MARSYIRNTNMARISLLTHFKEDVCFVALLVYYYLRKYRWVPRSNTKGTEIENHADDGYIAIAKTKRCGSE